MQNKRLCLLPVFLLFIPIWAPRFQFPSMALSVTIIIEAGDQQPRLGQRKSLPDNYSVLSSHPLNTSLQYACSRIIWEQVCFIVVDNGYGSQDLESWCALLLLGPWKPNNTHACTHTDYSCMDLHVSETIQCFTEFLVWLHECIHKSRYLHRRIQTLPAPQFFLASPRGLCLHTTSLRRNPAPSIPHVICYLLSVRTLTAPPAAFSTLLLNPWADQNLCEAPKTRRTSYTAKHIIASSYSVTSCISLSPLTKQFKT